MPNTFTLQVNRRDPRPRSPRLRNLGASASGSGTTVVDGQQSAAFSQQLAAAIADLTERIANAYLSKLHDDVAAGRITFEQGLRALRTVNVEAADLVITAGQNDQGGNIDADGDISAGGDISADSNITADGDISAGGDITADGNLDVADAAVIGGNTTIGGFIGSPSFASDLTGHGWRIGGPNNNGHGELDSLTLRKFLEVPELRYNRTEVHVGVDWHTHGAGLIEDVIHPDGFAQNRGIIKLKLEDGEIGAVAVDDYCMGIFHDEGTPSNNYQPDPEQEETPVQDSHNGNFKFAGFMTVYFKVVAICDANGDTAHPDSRNQYFLYELRPESNTAGNEWLHSFHPQPSMSFACYANPNRDDRQSCIYSTTDYVIMLVGMTDWTYDGDNIAYIRGYLDGFTIPERHLVNGEWVDTGQYKTLSGYGIAFGKAYMWGSIEQFNRAPFLLTQQLYQKALNVAPSVVFANDNWLEDYMPWYSSHQQPTPNAPYLYSYWLQTFSDNSTKIIGPSLSGYDNSLFTAVLNKDIISLALSDWYVDGNSTDVLDFDVDAKLLRGSEQIPIVSATATSTISGFSFDTPVSIDQHDIAHFHLHITGFVPQQVENVLAENNYVTFRLYADQTNYAEHTLAITENRQGEAGEDGDDALLYTLEASRREFSHTDNNPVDFRLYCSRGSERVAYIGCLLLVEYDINGNVVGNPFVLQSVKSIIGWRPYANTVVRADVYAFLTRADQIQYLGYLLGHYQTYDVEPSAFVSATLAEPIIELKLSHEGTINYPLEPDTRIPEENSFTIYARMYANSMKLTLTSLTCEWVSGGSGTTGVVIAQCDGAPNENIDFETVTSTAVANSTKLFRITASAVYGGKTYTLSKDITFCPVSAGTSSEGQPGIQGCVIRLRGTWDRNGMYYNDTNLTAPRQNETARYIDVVQYEDSGTVKWFQRKVYSTNYMAGIVPTNPTYWAESNKFEFIATQLLIAENANIKFGQGNQILIMDDSTPPKIVGGLTGFDRENPEAYRLWLGAEQPGIAPFSVTHEGALFAANVNSQFQDVSYCCSAGEREEGSGYEPVRAALNLSDIKTGTSLVDENSQSKSIKARVYNLIANGTKIILPKAIEFVGTRILICNTSDNYMMDDTAILQEDGKVFLGTKVYGLIEDNSARTAPRRAGETQSGESAGDPQQGDDGYQTYQGFTSSIWRLVTEDVTLIDFCNGIMEFIAIPDVDGATCVWSLLNESVAEKYMNGYRQQPNYTKQ